MNRDYYFFSNDILFEQYIDETISLEELIKKLNESTDWEVYCDLDKDKVKSLMKLTEQYNRIYTINLQLYMLFNTIKRKQK